MQPISREGREFEDEYDDWYMKEERVAYLRYQDDEVNSFKCEINLWICRLCHVKNWAPVQRIYDILKKKKLLISESGIEVWWELVDMPTCDIVKDILLEYHIDFLDRRFS